MSAAARSNDLVLRGLGIMVGGLVGNLQQGSPGRQLSAIKALLDLLRTHPPSAVQLAFRDAKGFPPLVSLLAAVLQDPTWEHKANGGNPSAPAAVTSSSSPMAAGEDLSRAPSTSSFHALFSPYMAAAPPAPPAPRAASGPTPTPTAGGRGPHASNSGAGGGGGGGGVGGAPLHSRTSSIYGWAREGCLSLSTDPPAAAVAVLAATALTELIRNNPVNRQSALQAGALRVLCGVLRAGLEDPLSVDVLRCMYVFVRGDNSGYLTSELVECNAVAVLCALLSRSLNLPVASERDRWAQEAASILYILSRRSRVVASLLAEQLDTLVRLLDTCMEPIALSLGLDIVEELVHSSASSSFAEELALHGGLQASARVLHIRGLGSKVVLLWARLLGDAVFREALAGGLSTRDLALLVQMASHADDADDLDANASRQVIHAVLDPSAGADRDQGGGGTPYYALRRLVLGRCLGPALGLKGVQGSLAKKAAAPSAAALIANLGPGHAAEAAIAAALLVRLSPAYYLPLLRRPPTLESLMHAVCDEVERVDSAERVDFAAGGMAAAAASGGGGGGGDVMARSSGGSMPPQQQQQQTPGGGANADQGAPGSGGGVGEVGAGTGGGGGDGVAAGGEAVRALGQLLRFCEQQLLQHQQRSRHSRNSSRSAGASRVTPLTSPRSSASASAAALARTASQDSAGAGAGAKYESVRVVIGGRDFFALSWLLESSSPVLRAAMAQGPPNPESKFLTLELPPIPGLAPNRAYEVFGMAVEYLYTDGSVGPRPGDLADVWALAATLQMHPLARHCEAELARSPGLDSLPALSALLALAQAIGAPEGTSMQQLLAGRLLDMLPGEAGSPALGRLVMRYREMLAPGMAQVLASRLAAVSAAMRQESHGGRSSSAASGLGAGGAMATGPVDGGPRLSQDGGPQRLSRVGSDTLSGTISADSAADWSRQLSSVFAKKLPPVRTNMGPAAQQQAAALPPVPSREAPVQSPTGGKVAGDKAA